MCFCKTINLDDGGRAVVWINCNLRGVIIESVKQSYAGCGTTKTEFELLKEITRRYPDNSDALRVLINDKKAVTIK